MQLHRLACLFGASTLLLLGAYACGGDDDSSTPDTDAGADTGTPVTDTGTTETPDTGSTTDAGDGGLDGAVPAECNGNPLLADGGTGGAVVDSGLFTVATNQFLYGPQWIDELGGQITYNAVSEQVVYRAAPDAGAGTPATALLNLPDASFTPLQSDYYQGALYTTYAISYGDMPSSGSGIIRTPLDGGASQYIALPTATLSSPNGVVISQKGIAFIADPGFQTNPTLHTGVFRMAPDGGGLTAVTPDGQPVGVALNKDQSKLFVSYANDSRLMVYTLGADGLPTVAGPTAFTATAPLYTPLGLAVDEGGNLWVAETNAAGTNGAVEVYSADGTKKWGRILLPMHATGIAFGGADRKKVFITTENGVSTASNLYSLPTRCPGNL